MSDVFGEVEALVFPRLGIEIVDLRSLSNDEASAVILKWHTDGQAFLKAESFPAQETCINRACIADLHNAYVDHAEKSRSDGVEPLTYEEFSRENFDRLVDDYVAKPHLGMHWFGIRLRNQREFTGAISISNIEPVKQDSRLLTLCGFPSVIHPPFGRFTRAEVSGAINRFIMDNDLITIDPDEPNVDFVEWHLPTHPDSRYVVRGANTYGRDVFEEMADGVKVRFGDAAVGMAPVEVKRELQPSDDPSRFPDFTRPDRTGGSGGTRSIPLEPSSSAGR